MRDLKYQAFWDLGSRFAFFARRDETVQVKVAIFYRDAGIGFSCSLEVGKCQVRRRSEDQKGYGLDALKRSLTFDVGELCRH
jgi:hypothetical protein